MLVSPLLSVLLKKRTGGSGEAPEINKGVIEMKGLTSRMFLAEWWDDHNCFNEMLVRAKNEADARAHAENAITNVAKGDEISITEIDIDFTKEGVIYEFRGTCCN